MANGLEGYSIYTFEAPSSAGAWTCHEELRGFSMNLFLDLGDPHTTFLRIMSISFGFFRQGFHSGSTMVTRTRWVCGLGRKPPGASIEFGGLRPCKQHWRGSNATGAAGRVWKQLVETLIPKENCWNLKIISRMLLSMFPSHWIFEEPWRLGTPGSPHFWTFWTRYFEPWPSETVGAKPKNRLLKKTLGAAAVQVVPKAVEELKVSHVEQWAGHRLGSGVGKAWSRPSRLFLSKFDTKLSLLLL